MSRGRGLTPDDRQLWAMVRGSVRPLHPEPRRPADDPAVQPKAKPGPRQPPAAPRALLPPPAAVLRIAGPSPARAALPDIAPTPAEALRAQPVRMDHKTHKQMTRGKLRPEARLDLHGMTLAEAGPELANFIISSHARGLRLVLVITGKGSRGGDHGLLPGRSGALRHQVPVWLHHAALSRIVQQVAPAHLRHGGTGAYYVYLRRDISR
ncbi:MAG: Smr/MutS family protein [Paracoccus sp. (in: a-proteobacteria)]|nr:Smr/MutS family protein [Paracoccus sp. (in: a-proteobacteria)]